MSTLWRNLKNPRGAVYKVFAVQRWVMPHFLGRLFAIGNRPRIPGLLRVETYDGSGQAVHPTVVRFHDQEYMACTPYPYGSETYENPCVYLRSKDGLYQSIPAAFPIVRPQKLGAEHYSDPWLGTIDDALELVYRQCLRTKTGKKDRLYLTRSCDGKQWTAPTLLLEKNGDELISPMGDLKNKFLYCVESDGQTFSRLMQYSFDGNSVQGPGTSCGVEGVDSDWLIWHIDGGYGNDGAFYGCFMMAKKGSRLTETKLSLFIRRETVWHWVKDILLSKEEAEAIRFVYKSAILNETHLLCSAADRKGRFFLFEKTVSEGLK